jgi:hypothetical protein
MTLTRAQEYLAHRQEADLVEITLPSSKVFVFEKPSKFGMLFGMGQLPQFAASGAVQKWTEEGIVKGIQDGDADTLKLAQVAFTTRDRVLALSHSPKLVVGVADPAKDELSTDDVSDDDLTYLFKWVQAGGDESMMLDTFPNGQQQRPVARPNRKARRAKAK